MFLCFDVCMLLLYVTYNIKGKICYFFCSYKKIYSVIRNIYLKFFNFQLFYKVTIHRRMIYSFSTLSNYIMPSTSTLLYKKNYFVRIIDLIL